MAVECRLVVLTHFNPLAPRGARRPPDRLAFFITYRFQSTRPAGGETPCILICAGCFIFQSTRPAGGETMLEPMLDQSTLVFQSTRPAGGETGRPTISCWPTCNFNPLAPRGARLPSGSGRISGQSDFNPLAPRGARRRRCHGRCGRERFQSTRPAGGETFKYRV